jgi:hypothetical protein
LTIDSWFYSESLISTLLNHNQAQRLDVSKLTDMVFIDLLAEQRNLRLTEEGLAIAGAAVPATQKTVRLAKPLTAGVIKLPSRASRYQRLIGKPK